MTDIEHWPLRNLVLRTPRLELRPDDDAGLFELVEVAYRGVHPPEQMPFAVPWTDADPRYMGRGSLQFFWSQRAQLAPEAWSVNFLVRWEGRVVGTQTVTGIDFAVTREIETGSWLGMEFQRRGIGTEMRAAVLQLAFDHLGARRARTSAFTDNVASNRVSRRLGYRTDGGATMARRGQPADLVRFVLEPDQFVRPGWTVEATGLAGCRALLGAA